jgi:4-amino-4-deoxy-L-arabinose transferase-like glycosyltransferase
VRRAFPSLILLAAISCGSLFFRLGSLPLCGADEPRYARIAQEMRDQSNWITPLLEGKPWLEKPPLYYWITAPLYSIFNSKETAARLGPSLCALIASVAIFWIGTALWSRIVGFLSACILLTCPGFAAFGRSASTDMPFTCCLTIAMAIFAYGVAMDRRIGWRILFGYFFLGLAILGKGPVAIVLAAAIMLCFWYLDERGGILKTWRVVPGTILTAAIAIPWFWLVFRHNGFAFISTFFINHNLARYITGIHHHSQPVYYYLPVLIGLFFPWSGWLTLLLPKSFWHRLRRWREWNPATVFLTCWFLIPLLFFSLSDSKLPGYILPSLPPLALILGVQASRVLNGLEASIGKTKMLLFAGLNLLLSAAIAVATPIFFRKAYGGNWKPGLLLAAAVLIPALFGFWFGVRRKYSQAFKATAIQGLLIILFLAQFAFPIIGSYHSTREIAHRALDWRHSAEPIVTYRFFHHSLHYYTGYAVSGRLDDAESLIQFVQSHPDSLVVTDIRGMREIEGIAKLSAIPLAVQGDFRLLRMQFR